MNRTKNTGVIFDIDGVLVDSNPAHFKSWVITAKEFGFDFTAELFQQTFGQTSRAIVAGHWNRPVTEEEIIAIDKRKEDLYREYVPEFVKPIPGVFELIKQLVDQGYSVGVGSSGPRVNVDFVIDFFDLRGYLLSIVSGTDVARGKPAPDIFLKAAKEMNISPNQCVIIDDSESGILAGCAAGMKTVGFFSWGHLPYEYEKANLVVHSFEELSPVILENIIWG